MRRLFCLLLIMILSLSRTADASERELAEAVNSFALDLYRVTAGESGNLFFSPYSVADALAMTYAGASGDTAAEMEKVLHFEALRGIVHPQMMIESQRLNSIHPASGDIATANRVWLSDQERLLPDYVGVLKYLYDSDVQLMDFKKDSDGSRVTINKWVEEKTRDRIKNLLTKGDIVTDTRMILTNAIYFKANWLTPFVKKATVDGDFKLTAAKTKKVPMMTRHGDFDYGERDGVQMIRLPYEIPGFSMVVLLPRENEDFSQLTALEKTLTAPGASIAGWTSSMGSEEVVLTLPKFKSESRFTLSDGLKSLGMKLAFSSGDADFSGINGERSLHMDEVIHKSFIEVDEKGTEAAAATAVTMLRTTAMRPDTKPIEFRADHPFIYLVQDDASGVILFMGRLMEP